jgi:hypothetical protein
MCGLVGLVFAQNVGLSFWGAVRIAWDLSWLQVQFWAIFQSVALEAGWLTRVVWKLLGIVWICHCHCLDLSLNSFHGVQTMPGFVIVGLHQRQALLT